jgi:hypothetical protein
VGCGSPWSKLPPPKVSMNNCEMRRSLATRQVLTALGSLLACCLLLLSVQAVPIGASQVRASAATDIQLPPSDAKQSFPQISERDRVASNPGNPHVASTLVLANNTLFPGNYLPTDPQSPDSVVYDNATGEFFIADYYSASVTVINASTEEIISDITVGNKAKGKFSL